MHNLRAQSCAIKQTMLSEGVLRRKYVYALSGMEYFYILRIHSSSGLGLPQYINTKKCVLICVQVQLRRGRGGGKAVTIKAPADSAAKRASAPSEGRATGRAVNTVRQSAERGDAATASTTETSRPTPAQRNTRAPRSTQQRTHK